MDMPERDNWFQRFLNIRTSQPVMPGVATSAATFNRDIPREESTVGDDLAYTGALLASPLIGTNFVKNMAVGIPAFEVFDQLPTVFGQDRATVQGGNLLERGFRAISPDGKFEETVAPYVNQAGQVITGLPVGGFGELFSRRAASGIAGALDRAAQRRVANRLGYFEPMSNVLGAENVQSFELPEDRSLLDYQPISGSHSLPGAEEQRLFDSLNLVDLTDVQRTRDWLKGFNNSFVKRYHYDPIPLNYSEDPIKAENAVKDLLHRHNRVVRGVDDFMGSKTSLKPYEKDFMKKLMAREGYNPESREERLMFAASTYAPSFSGYGRAGVVTPLVRIMPDGTVKYHGEPSFDLFSSPGRSALGTHYASNSIGTGQGYTYGTGKVGLLEYPFELGPDRNLWQYEADFPVMRDTGELPFDNQAFRTFMARNALRLNDKPVPDVRIAKEKLWLDDVMPSKMTIEDIDRWRELGLDQGKSFRNRNAKQLLDRAYSYLNRSARIDPNVSNVYKTDYGLPEEINRKLSKFYKESGTFGYIQEPKTVGDWMNNLAIYNVLEKKGPRQLYSSGAPKYIGKEIKAERDRLYNVLHGKNDKTKLLEALQDQRINLEKEFDIMLQNGDENLNLLLRKVPRGRFIDATNRNTKKSDGAFSHYISVGNVGKEAAKFIDWVNTKDFNPEEIGAITRQHYGTGAGFLTRNTRGFGGLISRLQKHYGSNEKALEAVRKFAGGGDVNAMYDPNGIMWSQPKPTELPEAVVRGPYDWDAMKLRQYWGESRFRDNLTSPAGAKGAFQIMPITQKDYILRGGVEGDLMDKAYNEGIRDDLVALLRRDPYFDEANTSPESFAAMVTGAYNIGRSGFKKRLKELENHGYDIRHSTDWVDAFPVKETRNYMKWVGLGQDVGGDLTNEAFGAAVEKNGFKSGGKIHIKPENRGKFTALKKRTGHSASWFKAHGTPAQKKMATFALNARKWKHGDGGIIDRLYNHSGGDVDKMLELIQKARSA